MLNWMRMFFFGSWGGGIGPLQFEMLCFCCQSYTSQKKNILKICSECIGFGMVKVEREGRF